jgi:hypothetical protein
MRAPIRSECDAFWFVLAGAALLAVALVIGWLAQPRIGAAVFVVTATALIVAYIRVASRDRRAVLRAAAGEPHPHGAAPGRRHVLVIANEPLSGAELRERILARDGERVEIDVLAPVLTSRVHLSVSDIDREVAEAHGRLERSLAWARAQGIVARGEVGEPSPITAIEDELRDFGADEVIVVTHPRERETWQERGELKRLRRELDVPVTHVVVEDGGAAQQTTL